jgi:hypothetical protein
VVAGGDLRLVSGCEQRPAEASSGGGENVPAYAPLIGFVSIRAIRGQILFTLS